MHLGVEEGGGGGAGGGGQRGAGMTERAAHGAVRVPQARCRGGARRVDNRWRCGGQKEGGFCWRRRGRECGAKAGGAQGGVKTARANRKMGGGWQGGGWGAEAGGAGGCWWAGGCPRDTANRRATHGPRRTAETRKRNPPGGHPRACNTLPKVAAPAPASAPGAGPR
ncbi:MAG: hypothetical protein IPP22_06450 [Nitrosomonas sp.]|nr:hypothetical protein [Nitrosomonas sp.]